MKRGNRGATLLELVIVLTLTTGVMWMTLPELSRTFYRAQLKTKSEQIVLILKEAKTLSTQYGQSFVVKLGTERELILHERERPTKTLRAVTLPQTVTLFAPPQGILFSPNQSNTPARLLLTSQEERCEIVIALRGRIRRSCSE
jgi:Tfp pilus assembly protein FimT